MVRGAVAIDHGDPRSDAVTALGQPGEAAPARPRHIGAVLGSLPRWGMSLARGSPRPTGRKEEAVVDVSPV